MSNPESRRRHMAAGEPFSTVRYKKIDDSKVATRLLNKNYSPLCVRKYQMEGWPLFVGIICDLALSDLDEVVHETADEARKAGMFSNDIQSLRNFTGVLSDSILEHYNSIKTGSVEGVAIFYYIDKCAISSLWGDFMTHESCRNEFYFIINTLPHI